MAKATAISPELTRFSNAPLMGKIPKLADDSGRGMCRSASADFCKIERGPLFCACRLELEISESAAMQYFVHSIPLELPIRGKRIGDILGHPQHSQRIGDCLDLDYRG